MIYYHFSRPLLPKTRPLALATPHRNSFKPFPSTTSTGPLPLILPHLLRPSLKLEQQEPQKLIKAKSILFLYHLDSFRRQGWRGKRVGGKSY